MANLWRRCPSPRLRAGDLAGTLGGTAKNIAGQFFETETIIYYGILKRWNGATFIKEPARVYTASGWQDKPLKRWSGTAWLLVDTKGI
jgi:hypothetical protein